MSSISGISGASSAWSSMIAMRGNRPPGGKDPAEMFAKVDTDGNGSVDEAELQTMLDDISEKTGTSFDASAGDMLSKMDSDGDGSLSQTELDEGMRSMMPPPSTMDFAQSRGAEGGGDDLFGKIDTDGDGKVSSDELQSLFDKMGVEEDATERFAELDTDGDGSLSQTEFEAGRPHGGMPPPPPPSADASDSSDSTTDALQALLDALDSNGDHQVSDDEAQSFLDQLNEEQKAAQSSQGSSSGTQRLTLLVQQAYAQLSATFSSQGSTVNATA